MIRRTVLASLLLFIGLTAASAQAAKPLRVYFVGNSVTDTINYRALAERWPRQSKDDFDTAWLKKYTGGWDGTNETKDYFERLTLELRKTCPNLKKLILMVPVGHVMHELNQRMKAGEVPGHKEIKDVFADGIHLNNVGSYVVGCTYFATLYRENPKGLPGEPYKVTDPNLAEVIQETVWKVVSTTELAGVKPPVNAIFAPSPRQPR